MYIRFKPFIMKRIIAPLLFLVCFIPIAAQEGSPVNDARDGKTYRTFRIEDQTWMAENLVFKVDGACWAYDDDQSNVEKYGYMYNFQAAQLACPDGWRLPTRTDFEILLDSWGEELLLPGFDPVLGGAWDPLFKQYSGLERKTKYWAFHITKPPENKTDSLLYLMGKGDFSEKAEVTLWHLFISDLGRVEVSDAFANPEDRIYVRCIKE